MVLSPEEVATLIEAVADPVHRLCARAAYACGLRIGEVVRLRVEDIDSARMMLNVRQAEGGMDATTPAADAPLPTDVPTLQAMVRELLARNQQLEPGTPN